MVNMNEIRNKGISELLKYCESVITEIEIEKLNGKFITKRFIKSESDKMTAMAQLLGKLGLLKDSELGAIYYDIDNFENGYYDLTRIRGMLSN